MRNHLFEVDPYFLSISERLPRVALSLAIAMLATFVALDLAGRVHRAPDRISARLWILAGSLALGTGVWSMHFVGMSAPIYTFKAAYEVCATLLSWVIAVVVSALFLSVAERQALQATRLWGYAAVVGLGTTTMHFVGMQALVVTPEASLRPAWIVAAVASAIGGSGLAIAMGFRLRSLAGSAQLRSQLLAAGLFGSSLAAMHYLAMAAVKFDGRTVCHSQDGIDAGALGGIVAFAALGFLSLMLLVMALERRAERLARSLSDSLEKAEQELQYITFNDPLTNLPNRLVFQERLQRAVQRCDRHGQSLAVLLVEVDGTLALQHTLGDAECDLVIKEVGARLVRATRRSDAVACVGRYQFLVLLVDGLVVEDSAAVATRIGEALAQPCCTGRKEARVSVSIGGTTYPADGAADKIVQNANSALEASKTRGGNCHSFFEPEMDAEARESAEWLEDLRLAVPRHELELFYQPKIDAQSGKISGAEALLRWRHPGRGIISPALFIPLAERFGLINELGSWVIREACRQMGIWSDMGIRMRVAINLSVMQLRQPDLAAQIETALASNFVEPRLLTCEITESGAMVDTQATLAVFKTLEAAGIQLSIDDFGTGYSSLSYLRKLPVRQLKIDRSFVMDLGKSEDAKSVASAIIELAHALRLEVVAEGVETEIQRQVLLELGVDKLQGFLFARPMTASSFTDMVSEATTRREQFRESLFPTNWAQELAVR